MTHETLPAIAGSIVMLSMNKPVVKVSVQLIIVEKKTQQDIKSTPRVYDDLLRSRGYVRRHCQMWSERNIWGKGQGVWGVIAAKILFQILLCRTCAVYKFFAENTRTEIEQTK